MSMHTEPLLLPRNRMWLPDHREPRDWKRPWREPPRMSASCCCSPGNDCGGCTGVPDNLHVTFAVGGFCPLLDGLTFALTNICHSGGGANCPRWTVTIPAPGDHFLCPSGIVVELRCVSPSRFQLIAYVAPSGASIYTWGSTVNSCSPINISFTGTGGLAATCLNCSDGIHLGPAATVTL